MRLAACLLLLAAARPTSAQRPYIHSLPATGAFVDSAAAAELAARLATPAGKGKIVLGFVMDSAGTVRTARVVEAGPSADGAAALRDSVLPLLRTQAPWTGGRWWLRLVFRLDSRVSVRTERSREDAPAVLLTGPELAGALQRVGLGITGSIEMNIFVGEDGRVLRVEPAGASAAGRSALEQLGTQLRFRPGRVEGEPQPMWTSFKLQRAGLR